MHILSAKCIFGVIHFSFQCDVGAMKAERSKTLSGKTNLIMEKV